jgi:antirestriction protein
LGVTSTFFKEYFKNRFDYENELAKFVKEDIMEPAKKFLDTQNTLGKSFYIDFKKFEKDWTNAVLLTDKVKIHYLDKN